MNDLQKTQLYIAKEVKRICDKHNINYFLDFGTLLGAVRHKGFIPWDDDFDIGMLRNDYEHFIKIAEKELKPRFFLQNHQTDPYFGGSYSKIRLNNTHYIEGSLKKNRAHNGIFIDIFPYDSINPSDKAWKGIKIKLTLLRFMMRLKNRYTPWTSNGFSIVLYIAYLPLRFLTLFFSKEHIFKLNDKIAHKFNNTNAKYLYPQEGEICGKYVFPRNHLKILTELEFEGIKFKASAAYDEVLTIMYGDYMQLPPIEKRQTNHALVECQLDPSIFKD